jgi:lysophospholipase L1-like esterase
VNGDVIVENDFRQEIDKFIQENKKLGKRKDSVVLYGSSTFTIWQNQDIARDLPDYEVINRGFGGSSAQLALKYLDEAVVPVGPKALFYYEGANDIARGQSVDESFSYTFEIYKKLSGKNGDLIWIFLLMHMCPGRKQFHTGYENLNKKYIDFCRKHKNCFIIDSNEIIYNEFGEIDENVYLDDGIHFTEQGYKRFGRLVNRYFEKIFNHTEMR